jgi:hypothetical protein
MKEKIFHFGAFWCDLVDRLLLAKSSIRKITRNRTKEVCVTSIQRHYASKLGVNERPTNNLLAPRFR